MLGKLRLQMPFRVLTYALCILNTDGDNINRELSWKVLNQRILGYHAFSLVTPLEVLLC